MNQTLQIENQAILRRYFYGSKGPRILASLGAWLGLIIWLFARPRSIGITIGILCVLGAIIWHLIERFMPSTFSEQVFDSTIENNFAQLSPIALEKLGLVNEQVSLITPIKVSGPFDNFDEIDLQQGGLRRNPFVRLLLIMLFIVTSPISFLVYGIYHIVTFSNYQPSLVFKAGTDDNVRYSLVQAHIFLFSEDQVYVYRASYDICSGEFYEDSTTEYFYQDIDCVITGQEHRKVFSGRKIVEKTFEFFRLIVTSGTSTHAYADVPVTILDTELMGMRALIRNKKLEMYR